MAYACPVCETPQADGRHLANHLAFTAMIHGDDHEVWLDEHAPGWEAAGEEALAKRVIGKATETDLSTAIDDPTEGEKRTESEPHSHPGDDHTQGTGERVDRPPMGEGKSRRAESPATVRFGTETDSGENEDERDVAAIVAEARELTERMHNRASTSTEGESERSEPGLSETENPETNGDSDENEDER